jgi:hypothetical protein
MLLVTIALCAEWVLQCDGARAIEVNRPYLRMYRRWSIASGIAWGLAIWISAYESLVLFFITMVVSVLEDRKAIFANYRRSGWCCFMLIIATALLIEQRIPAISIFRSNEIFKNWARTIGELAHVSPANPVWFHWAGLYGRSSADLALVIHQKARRRGALAAASKLWSCSASLRCPHRHLFPHDLAGALGIFFRFDLCNCTFGFARADQIARCGFDRFYIVDLSNLARLGRAPLAQRGRVRSSSRTAKRVGAAARTGDRFAIV